MKATFKFLLLLLAHVACLSAQAQTHLRVLGTEIDGTIDDFEQKLIAKGYTRLYADTDKRIRGYSGTYAGVDCMAAVTYTDNRRVFGIGFQFPAYDKFGKRESHRMQAENLFERITKKYISYAKDHRKHAIFGQDIVFTLPEGVIQITFSDIDVWEDSKGTQHASGEKMSVYYADKINSLPVLQQIDDDI